MRPALVSTLAAVAASACSLPDTEAVVANHYAATTDSVVYRVVWTDLRFTDTILPGADSAPQPAFEASTNTAYALLAPGFEPTSVPTPQRLVVLESITGFAASLGDTTTITVDDTTFAGNCAGGSHLPQAEADLLIARVFRTEFAPLAGTTYDAATCTMGQ
jgi:hypothetical protein